MAHIISSRWLPFDCPSHSPLPWSRIVDRLRRIQIVGDLKELRKTSPRSLILHVVLAEQTFAICLQHSFESQIKAPHIVRKDNRKNNLPHTSWQKNIRAFIRILQVVNFYASSPIACCIRRCSTPGPLKLRLVPTEDCAKDDDLQKMIGEKKLMVAKNRKKKWNAWTYCRVHTIL